MLPTPAGFMVVLPLRGLAGEAVARISGHGEVAVTRLDGPEATSTVWRRTDQSFVREVASGSYDPYVPAFVRWGVDPVDPTRPIGEHPFAVADLTQDGVDDVVVAHEVASLGDRTRSTVDVLDGRDGTVVWRGVYPGEVPEVVVSGTTLVVAEDTGAPRQPGGVAPGAVGSTSSLHGITFTLSQQPSPPPVVDPPGNGRGKGNGDGNGHGKGNGNDHGGTTQPPPPPPVLTVTEAWNQATGVEWAHWTTLEATGSGVVAGWTNTPTGSAAPRGTVLALDAESGRPAWTRSTDDYPRALRWDGTRKQVVLLQQADTFASDGPNYSLTALNPATGLPLGAPLTRANALPVRFRIGDIAGDASPEWVTTDLEVAPSVGACPTVDVCASTGGLKTASRVTAYDSTTGTQLWQQTQRPTTSAAAAVTATGQGSPSQSGLAVPYGLLVADHRVLTSSLLGDDPDTALSALDGASGNQLWTRTGNGFVLPLWIAAGSVDGKPALYAASSRGQVYGANVSQSVDSLSAVDSRADTPYNVVQAFDAATGETLRRIALLGDIRGAVAASGLLVVGTDSGAVIALDSTTLSDTPQVVWQRTLPTQVHELTAADLDGDGTPEVVAVAAHQVSVLALRSGEIRWTATRPDWFLWTASVGDVDGDGHPDVVVPSDALTAYDGRSGAVKWTWRPSGPDVYALGSPAIAGGVVAANYSDGGVPADVQRNLGSTQTATENDVVVDGRTGVARWTHTQSGQAYHPTLWHSSVLAPGLGGVTGMAAAFGWTSTESDGFPHARMDIYDVATGALTVAVTADGVVADQVATAGDRVLLLSSTGSASVGPDGTVTKIALPVPQSVEPFSVGGSAYFAVATAASLQALYAPQSLTKTSPTRSGAINGHMSIGGLSRGDVDGDGQDELLSFPYDWDAAATATLPMGYFGFAISAEPRGLQIIRVAPAS